MRESKTEMRIVGHILEHDVVLKLSKVLKDLDVEVMNCNVSFAALKAGVEKKMPSIMRFYLVGEKDEREKAIREIEKLVEATGCTIDYIKEMVA